MQNIARVAEDIRVEQAFIWKFINLSAALFLIIGYSEYPLILKSKCTKRKYCFSTCQNGKACVITVQLQFHLKGEEITSGFCRNDARTRISVSATRKIAAIQYIVHTA